MSLINEYRATEEAIKELQERLKNLSQDGKLQRELDFEKQLRSLMAENNKSLRDIIEILDPSFAQKTRPAKAPAAPTGRRSRKMKRFKNPYTGETIETKGGNHTILKAWKAQWGSDVVEGWATTVD